MGRKVTKPAKPKTHAVYVKNLPAESYAALKRGKAQAGTITAAISHALVKAYPTKGK